MSENIEEIGYKINLNFDQIAIAFVKSLTDIEYKGLKLGIIPPVAFEKFMVQLGISIAKKLVTEIEDYKDISVEDMASSFNESIRIEVEQELKTAIKNLIKTLKTDKTH